jgi:hypothetical protein
MPYFGATARLGSRLSPAGPAKHSFNQLIFMKKNLVARKMLL